MATLARLLGEHVPRNVPNASRTMARARHAASAPHCTHSTVSDRPRPLHSSLSRWLAHCMHAGPVVRSSCDPLCITLRPGCGSRRPEPEVRGGDRASRVQSSETCRLGLCVCGAAALVCSLSHVRGLSGCSYYMRVALGSRSRGRKHYSRYLQIIAK